MRLLPLSLALILALSGCKKARTACVYEIPEGFSGWVLIEFGNTNCPPLEMSKGKRIFKIGSDGRFCTSSHLEYGWANDGYFYVGQSRNAIPSTVSGGGGLIWGRFTGSVQSGGIEKTYEKFFVGVELEFVNSRNQSKPF